MRDNLKTKNKDDRLRSLMQIYEGAQHTVVAASLSNGQSKIISSGQQVTQAPPDELIFEIGSITKVFASILLCVLVEEGKVDPRAPLCEMSDELADVPIWITPESLVAHISGLPRIHVPIWKVVLKPLPEDPYATFSRADLLEWFQKWRPKAPGSKKRHLYSNLGFGLLGEAMAMREGTSFPDLLEEKVIAPLGLKNTTDCFDQNQQSRFVQPKNTKGKNVVPWTFQAMAAAGSLRSSVGDLTRFSSRVIQALNSPETLLDRAICQSVVPIFGLGPKGRMEPIAQASGWRSVKFSQDDPAFLFHNGGTAGSTCAIYICPEKEEACVILSNNGVAANLWASTKLNHSNLYRQPQDFFRANE